MKLPFWATTLSICGIIVLCGLGTWQIQRLGWKTDLLSALEITRANDPMALELTVDILTRLDRNTLFVRGFVEGIYLHDKAITLGPRTFEGKPGYHLITPFETLDNHLILVNRGWIPLTIEDTAISKPDQPVIITGIARKIEKPGLFTPANNPEKNQWHRLDLADLSKASGLQDFLPYILYIDSGSGEYPVSGALKWQPANNHLSYALFWFTMAGLLFMIYILRFVYKKT